MNHSTALGAAGEKRGRPGTALFGKILVGYDGSKGARRALAMAETMAADLGSQLIVLEVPEVPIYAAGAAWMPPIELQEYYTSTRKRSEARVNEVVERLKARGVDAVGEVPNRSSSPAQTLVERARKGVDLVVVGTRGLGGFRKLLLGSVSNTLVAHAPCSVLVAR